MLTLLLFRHAKSSWDDPSLADVDRPLSPRGRRAAETMGKLIAKQGLVPDLVFCSPAVRARQTLDLAVPAWSPNPRVEVLDDLYTLMSGDYLDIIRTADTERLMIVAHNPATERTARALAGAGDPASIKQLHAKFPTAAVAVITFAHEAWPEVSRGSGKLEGFLAPS